MKTLKLLCRLTSNGFIFIYKYLITHYMTDGDNISTLLGHLNELSQESYNAHDMNPLEHTGGRFSWLWGDKRDKNKIADDTENTKQTTTSVTDDTPGAKDEEIIRLNLSIQQKDEDITRLKRDIERSTDHHNKMEKDQNERIQYLIKNLDIRMKTNDMLLNELLRDGTEWKNESEIACIIFLTPDRKHVWIFKFEKAGDNVEYPSNNNSDAKCSVEIRPTKELKTLREMLQNFQMGTYLGYHMLNYAGYNIDENQGIQTVILKRRKGENELLVGV